MKFYTNIQQVGDDILYRGFDHGERVQYREAFSPTLFVSSPSESKYKTLDGQDVKPMKFSGPRDAREFMKKYESVQNFDVYGYERFVYQYISDQHTDEVDYDFKKLEIYTIDIEVASENGFPDVQSAAEEVLCITMKNLNTKRVDVWYSGLQCS